jgi:hypothetical protein
MGMRSFLRLMGLAGALAGVSGVAQTAAVQPASAAAPAPVSAEKQLAAAQAKLMDWAQLGRYAAENAALAPAAAGEQRVVFYGDSITDAWGRRPGTGDFRASRM